MKTELKKPTKKVERPGSMIFYFDYASNKVSIDYFNHWVKDNLPKGAFDVTLSLEENWDEWVNANGDCDSGITSCSLHIEYKTLVVNTRYKSQMKKYEKQLAKWKEENGKR